MEVYYGSVAALVPVARAATGELDVDITYQGCADAGLCYPPITRTVSLLLPASPSPTAAPVRGAARRAFRAPRAGPGARPARSRNSGPAGVPAVTPRAHPSSRAPERRE